MHETKGTAHNHQGQTAGDAESRVRGHAEAHATHPRTARAGDRPKYASYTGKNAHLIFSFDFDFFFDKVAYIIDEMMYVLMHFLFIEKNAYARFVNYMVWQLVYV